jgi:hypothetical protein
MSFQWLQMRITEEKDRRARDAAIRERLPRALDELRECLDTCMESYREAFGAEAGEVSAAPPKIQIVVHEESGGAWRQFARVEVIADAALPGFRIERSNGAEPLLVEVGILPGDKIYYRDRALDKYLTMEELTRRILDRAFFPKLAE